jgi:wobble nucleotide-excising tRNase
MHSYEGDKELITAAKKVIAFYKNEAENEFPKVSDFYIKKDNFDKANEIMESKKKKDRTQEDVDKFNEAVKEYNEAAGSINETNENLNKNRSEMLDDWNKSVESFYKANS